VKVRAQKSFGHHYYTPERISELRCTLEFDDGPSVDVNFVREEVAAVLSASGVLFLTLSESNELVLRAETRSRQLSPEAAKD
jgi:hypothetical protein